MAEHYLYTTADLTDAPEVTEVQAHINQICKRGPRRARPARRGLLGVSESTLAAWVKAGQFPKPIYLTHRAPRWPAATVQAWLDAKGRE